MNARAVFGELSTKKALGESKVAGRRIEEEKAQMQKAERERVRVGKRNLLSLKAPPTRKRHVLHMWFALPPLLPSSELAFLFPGWGSFLYHPLVVSV